MIGGSCLPIPVGARDADLFRTTPRRCFLAYEKTSTKIYLPGFAVGVADGVAVAEGLACNNFGAIWAL